VNSGQIESAIADTDVSVLEPQDCAQRDPAAGGRPRLSAATAVVLTIMSLAPVGVVILQRAGRHYLPVQDLAVIDLRVRDVFTFSNNTPMVGAYSRFGWSHPGPAMYYLVAPFAWLFGNPAWATLVGFALLQGVAIIWTARLAWKSGGLRWSVIWLSILALSYGATGPWIVQQAWNPHVAFPFFVLFLLQCWVVARGDGQRLLGLAFVASFLVQAHIGYAILVAIIATWALGRLILRQRREGQVAGRSLWLPPAAVLVIMWFLPLVLDPILHFPGNIGHLLSFYLRSGNSSPILGLSKGLGYLATEFKWLPPWFGGSDPLNPLTGLANPASIVWMLVPLALVVGSWWVARRRNQTDLRLMAELVALLLTASAITLILLRGDPASYLFYWRIISGCATVVLALTVVIDGLDVSRHRIPFVAWTVFLAVALVVSSGKLASDVVGADGPVSSLESVTTSLLNQMQSQGQPDGPAIVRFWGSVLGGAQAGIVDQLSREGKMIFVDPALGFQFGYGRTATPEQVKWVLYVTEESQLYSTMSALPEARVVAVSHPLPGPEQAELVSLQRKLAAVLVAQHQAGYISYLGSPFVAFQLGNVSNMPPLTLRRLSNLNTEVQTNQCLCSVIEFPAGHIPPSLRPPPGQ
jgi:hypothetical protein